MYRLYGPLSWCLLSAALFGVSPAACKLLLGADMGTLSLASLLYLGAGIGTLPFCFHRARQRPTLGETGRIGLAVVFGGILGPICLMIGLSQSDAGSTSLLLNFESVATVILGWMFFKEHVSRTIALSCVLVVAGGLMLTMPASVEVNTGALWVLAACLCWGLDNHVTAVIDGYTPTQVTCIKGFVAGGFNGGLALAWAQPWGDPTLIGWGLAVGALCYGASMVLYVAGAQQIGATPAQMIFSSAPYWGLVAAWTVVGEPIFMGQIVASVLMMGALVVLQRDQHGHPHTHESTRHFHWHHHRDGHHDHSHDAQPIKQGFFGWHLHEHSHEPIEHNHPHRSDMHHRHH